MTKTITLKNVKDHLKQEVTILGWVFNLRIGGKIVFLQIRDGTGYIQAVVLANKVSEKEFSIAKTITQETSVTISGLVKEDNRSPFGYEIEATKIEVISLAKEDYPISKKEHGPDFLLDNRHLWLRSPRQQAIQIIRNELIYSISDFYKENDFIKIDTPIITPNACEGTTTLFAIDYFGKRAYLSQSGQLYLEAAIFSLRRVYDFTPVFRAEKSKTRRHLIEFWMTNAEAAFISHQENLEIQEKMIVYLIKRVLKNCLSQLGILQRDIEPLKKIKLGFPKISYQEAVEKLVSLGSDIKFGEDLGNDDETILSKSYELPLFVEFFPAKVKAFYMKRHPQEKKLALCADLLAPEGYGEIIGGSEREDNYEILLKSVKDHHLNKKDFQWYLDLRQYGSVPHSGFGLGLERILAWVCGLKHVRETIPFPRLLNRAYP